VGATRPALLGVSAFPHHGNESPEPFTRTEGGSGRERSMSAAMRSSNAGMLAPRAPRGVSVALLAALGNAVPVRSARRVAATCQRTARSRDAALPRTCFECDGESDSDAEINSGGSRGAMDVAQPIGRFRTAKQC
jgi:hypothetical protein